MSCRIFKGVVPWCIIHGESQANLELSFTQPVVARDGTPYKIGGVLEGPYCTIARTLTAQFPLRTGVDSTGQAIATARVTDPCFWTPALPFLYRLTLTLTSQAGKWTIEPMVGLRRWECDGQNFRLERKRVVLRGATSPSNADATLDDARAQEVTLLVVEPTDELCQEASRRGVGLIADLRNLGNAAPARLRMLAWHPAVLAALVDDCDSASDELPPMVATGCVVDVDSAAATLNARPWGRLIAVELNASQRPPNWLATYGRPVIAIRRGVAYADFHQARAACDRLQADLAPEFDLAGYFVTP
jgi:hypothetical protein